MSVSVSVTVTDAPAMWAPVESVTCPESDAFAVCASRAFRHRTEQTQADIPRIRPSPFIRQIVRAFRLSLLRKPSGVRKYDSIEAGEL